jgi:hypothetical protein
MLSAMKFCSGKLKMIAVRGEGKYRNLLPLVNDGVKNVNYNLPPPFCSQSPVPKPKVDPCAQTARISLGDLC